MRLWLLWVSMSFGLLACDGGFREQAGLEIRYCGNGMVEGDETCDDGNRITEACVPGEASCTVCNAACQLVEGATTICGDGVFDGAHEECDDGNAVTEPCPYGRSCDICDAACRRVKVSRYCGDGTVDSDADEACDDGAANSDTEPSACRTDCTAFHCGDGILDRGEECEPGSEAPDCREDCTLRRCGDGILDDGEACDPAPGETIACRDDCTLQGCGDGVLDPGEACDGGLFLTVDVAGRGEGACAIDRGGVIRCFGSDALRAIPPAAARGASGLTVGLGWACALSADRELVCWGEEPIGPDGPILEPPAGRFTRVAAGDVHACAIDEAGRLDCWGRLGGGRMPTSTGWVEVVSGRGFSCALHGEGAARCWGAPSFGNGSFVAPAGTFVALAAGRHHACGIPSDGGPVVCWGDEGAWRTDRPPSWLGDLALTPRYSCGLDNVLEARCWGEGTAGLHDIPAGMFTSLATVGDAVCGIAPGRIACWGEGAEALQFNADEIPGACRSDCSAPRCGDGLVDPGEACDDGNTIDDGNGCSATCERAGRCGDGIVQAVVETCDDGNAIREACAYGVSCEVCGESCNRVAGITPACGDSRLDPGESCDDGEDGLRFASLSVGGDHACGILEDGRVRCIGEGAPEPPPGDFVQVKTGGNFACGLKGDGSIECWGDLGSPAADGAFVSVEAGDDAACALDEQGALLCWGAIEAPPAGEGWQAVSLSTGSACAIDASGSVQCWGADIDAPPPPGPFTRIAVGSGFACAVDQEAGLHCWGGGTPMTLPRTKVVDLDAGMARLCVIDPAGMLQCVGPASGKPEVDLYRQVSVGGYSACGIAEDGDATCWGGDREIHVPGNNGILIAACPLDCRIAVCGDGVIDTGETCDDGNTTGGDGCSASCAVE